MAESWMLNADCRDLGPAVFFPTDGNGVEAAILICDTCPVRAECLEYALTNQIAHGVWGGTSERRRVQIRRERLLTKT